MSTIVTRALAAFRSEAKTIGVSPKALAPIIGAAVTALLAAAGVTPHDVAQLLGVSDELAAGAIATIAATVAARMLGPGNVVRPEPELTAGNDARLSQEARDQLGL